jgi:hypothetical protein
MAAFSDYLENALINATLRNTSYTSPTNVYVALFTATTGLEANNPTAEVTGGSYARQAVTFDAPSGGATQNAAELTFPAATANWGTVTHFAVVDHVSNTNWGTGVNVLYHGALTDPRVVNSSDTFKIPAADLDIALQ